MIRRIWKRLGARFLSVFGHSRLGVSIYYAIFVPRFGREHQALMAGKARFAEANGPGGTTSTKLRRSVHRIEKGLIMRPRRPVFALAYIEETIDAYKRAVEAAGKEVGEELCWARDVLNDYFEACEPHELIDRLRKEYMPIGQPSSRCRPDRSDAFRPYVRDLKAPVPVAYEDLLHLAERRRSVRWFEQRPVPRELIEKAVRVAGLSPSACNRQPFEFRFFDDPKIVQKIASLPGGTVGFHDNFPVVGVVLGSLAHYYDEKDRHLIYIDGSLATMSLVFALEALGLSSCCINWPDIEEYEVKADRALGLKPYERPVMFLAIGYPDHEGMVPYSSKKSVSELCSWNHIG